MTYKQTFWRLLTVMTVMLLTMPATLRAQSFGGGSGTYTDPYQIYNPSHFVELSDAVKAGNTFENVYFKLTNSVDFRLYGQIPPIGGQYYYEGNATGIRRFCGTFLGNNCTLYNLTITENPDQCGLFGYLGYGGYVGDLTIDGNSTITGIGNTGAIVGSADNNTYIFNCTVGENVVVKVHPDAAGTSYKPGSFGGIVGSTGGRVSGCVSRATVSNSGIAKTTELGGIAGEVCPSGKVEENYFLGTVDGTNTVGDIAGKNNGTVSRNYYNTANRHGGINGADTDGAKWMGIVTMGEGVSGSLPEATYTNGNKSYFATDKYMLLTLNYSAPEGYCQQGDQVSYKANDVAIGETERSGNQYYEFTMPDEDVTISAVADLKRDIAYSAWVKVNIPSLTYTGEQLTPTVQVTDIKDGAQQTLIEGEHFSVTWPEEIIQVGEYTATINGIGDYAGTNTVTFRVEPADAAVRIVTPPTAISGLTYNGQAQVLITAGEAEGGVMLYRLENEEYSTELPTAISAGIYTIYYKAHSDDNHLDTSEQSLVAQIAPATGSWDGEGTAEVPYLIKSVLDMNLIALKQNEMDYTGVYFRLENDLDYTDAELLPIGTLQRRFNGNFNGNGHTFTNLVINKPGETNVAIFAIVGNNGVISDLHLGEGCVITGGSCVGAFAGLFSGTISNCTTAPGVIVSSNHEVGGIVGRCVGKIDHCVNQASVITDNNEGNTAGGIAGSAYSTQSAASDISNNLNLGNVEAVNMVGGIVGYNGNTYTNNYYAGDCNVGGINGRDRDNQAQRGYTITGGNDVVVELIDDATVGLTFNGIVYAGAKQQVILKLSVSQNGAQHAPILRTGAQTSFIVSSGSLVDNGDGTWTLTMPETGEDVTISIDNTSTSITDIDADKPRSSQRYDLTGKPVGSSYRGIVIEHSAEGRLQSKKIIVK